MDTKREIVIERSVDMESRRWRRNTDRDSKRDGDKDKDKTELERMSDRDKMCRYKNGKAARRMIAGFAFASTADSGSAQTYR